MWLNLSFVSNTACTGARRAKLRKGIVKTNLLSTDKVIVTVAITGGLHGKEANSNLPITAEEQAQAAYDAYNAGASIVHRQYRYRLYARA